ncbi:IclR family transcriptional regulator [Candidatus Rhodoluna planktonica]|uniref:IclR family transcriptional regulator n=1 Tax=Candidatus Rhodoluna planktonica TaxID=535712 RepID=A0A1D9E0R4_9MICO|nr:IclR family transcriptional regulator [Candidatus Rhodoluna planktonica]AOY56636.1 hypothetical protein A4Z71_06785 [Candidatus Rhodoluna planktonica]
MSLVPAASRALAILRVLAKHGQPITAAAIAKELDLPRSSTYQLLEALVAEDFVVHFENESRWGLGVVAFELGNAYLRHDPIERFARPLLKELVGATEAQVPAVGQLGILVGDEVLYLLKELPLHPVTVVSDIGVRLPAHLTASGRAMLSRLDQKQLRATYSETRSTDALTNRTGLGPNRLAELKKQLEIDRRLGYAIEDGQISTGYCSVSVAAVNHLNLPTAALTLTFRSEDASESDRLEIARLLMAAASKLSKRMGAK